MTESMIVHENGRFWVLDDPRKGAYFVMRNGATHSESESAFARTENGKSLAVARCDYLARRNRDSARG